MTTEKKNIENDEEIACFFCGNKVEYKTDIIESWQGLTLPEPVEVRYGQCSSCKEYYYPAKYPLKKILELNECCRKLRSET